MGDTKILNMLQESNKLCKDLSRFCLDEIVGVAISKISAFFEVSYIALFLYELEDDTLEYWQHNQENLITVKLAAKSRKHVLSEAIASKKPVTFVDISEYQKTADITENVPFASYLKNHCILIPLLVGNDNNEELVGVLMLADRNQQSEFTPIDVALAVQIASVLGHTISRAKILEPPKTEYMVDKITGAFRWHPFYQYLAREVYRASRYQCELTLILLDLDGFQEINNKFGREAGDYVLEECARLVHRGLRNVDVTSRKDDCFFLMLPETRVNDAVIVAERLRKFINQHTFMHDTHTIPITASIGLVGYEAGETPVAFMKKGELSVDRAREKGGDQIITYDIVAESSRQNS